MDRQTQITAGVGVAAAVALVVGIASSSTDTPAIACSSPLSPHGSFIVEDDREVCELTFPDRPMRCELEPVADIAYQWSYRTTPTGVTVTGLKRGAHIAFECKE